MIQLGSKVKDLITGMVGVATGRTEWLYGCNRFIVEPQEMKDGKPLESNWYDEQRIELIGDGPLMAKATPQWPVSLGSMAKDKLTGFSGMIVARTAWLSGNRDITIEPSTLHEGKPIQATSFDISRIELIVEKLPPVSKQNSSKSGGPQNDPVRAVSRASH